MLLSSCRMEYIFSFTADCSIWNFGGTRLWGYSSRFLDYHQLLDGFMQFLEIVGFRKCLNATYMSWLRGVQIVLSVLQTELFFLITNLPITLPILVSSGCFKISLPFQNMTGPLHESAGCHGSKHHSSITTSTRN